MFSQIGFCKHLYERFCIKSVITQIEEQIYLDYFSLSADFCCFYSTCINNNYKNSKYLIF